MSENFIILIVTKVLERMPTSGMCRRVDIVWTHVSEERIASIFKVEKSESEEPAWAGGCRLQRHIPEDGILQSHRREILKSYKVLES
jgi:hypothetical protein